MTDNAKKALYFLKDNKEALERFKKAKDINEMLDLFKEYKLDITEEDLGITSDKKDFLEGKKKLDIEELSKVSGAGDVCACPIGGVGSSSNIECGCFLGGMGTGKDEKGESKVTCVCAIGGGGNNDYDIGGC